MLRHLLLHAYVVGCHFVYILPLLRSHFSCSPVQCLSTRGRPRCSSAKQSSRTVVCELVNRTAAERKKKVHEDIYAIHPLPGPAGPPYASGSKRLRAPRLTGKGCSAQLPQGRRAEPTAPLSVARTLGLSPPSPGHCKVHHSKPLPSKCGWVTPPPERQRESSPLDETQPWTVPGTLCPVMLSMLGRLLEPRRRRRQLVARRSAQMEVGP